MFKIGTWYAMSFDFVRDGKRYEKQPDSDDYFVDGCENQVEEDNELSHDTPVLIMWLIDLGAVVSAS